MKFQILKNANYTVWNVQIMQNNSSFQIKACFYSPVVLLQDGCGQWLVVTLHILEADGQCVALWSNQLLRITQVLQLPLHLKPTGQNSFLNLISFNYMYTQLTTLDSLKVCWDINTMLKVLKGALFIMPNYEEHFIFIKTSHYLPIIFLCSGEWWSWSCWAWAWTRATRSVTRMGGK